MIGHNQCICSDIHCPAGVLCRMNAFDDDWAIPCLTNPFEVFPSHDGLLESRSDIGIKHGTFSRDDDVFEFHQAAVCEKRHEPARPNENLINKRQHRSEISAKKFLRAITQVAFSETGDRRVDCDYQG